MKRIVLCGSRTFKDYIIQIGYKLEEEGYEVVIPKEFFVPMPKKNIQCCIFRRYKMKEQIMF